MSLKQYRYWKHTRLAGSLDALRPTPDEDTELTVRKRAAGLDPTHDYTTRQECLRCHTTGFGAVGGYPRDEIAAEKAIRGRGRRRVDPTVEMGSVSCEACHGAGERYVAHKKAKLKQDDRVRVTTEELVSRADAADPGGLPDLPRRRVPDATSDVFDFERRKDRVHSRRR